MSHRGFVMSGLAFGMAVSVVLTGAFTTTWPALAIGVVAGALSATAMSWHGILLSESARLAPAGRAGAVTGGVLSFGQMGAFLCPSVFSLLLARDRWLCSRVGGHAPFPRYWSGSTCWAAIEGTHNGCSPQRPSPAVTGHMMSDRHAASGSVKHVGQ